MLLIVIWVGGILALTVWGYYRMFRSYSDVRKSLEQEGYRNVRLNLRLIRSGPFRGVRRSDVVFQVRALEASGRERSGWARWGRKSLTAPDTFELLWDDRAR